jgi:hypothetical protein
MELVVPILIFLCRIIRLSCHSVICLRYFTNGAIIEVLEIMNKDESSIVLDIITFHTT